MENFKPLNKQEEIKMAVNIKKATATQEQETKVVMSVFLTNLTQYNSGNLVGLWLDLPTTTATIKSALEKIGCKNNGDASFSIRDEYFITDVDMDLNLEIPEFTNIFALNKVAKEIADLNIDPDILNAFLENGYTVQEAIEKAENGEYRYYYGCDDMEDVAEVIAEESGIFDGVPEMFRMYFDFKSYARDLEIEGYFHESDYGIIEIIK